jgi:hypothetical protein
VRTTGRGRLLLLVLRLLRRRLHGGDLAQDLVLSGDQRGDLLRAGAWRRALRVTTPAATPAVALRCVVLVDHRLSGHGLSRHQEVPM